MKNLPKRTTNLYRAILSLKNENEARKFFRDLLTEIEIEEFSRRFEVVQMLDKGLPYTEIENKTRMSSTTIARISKFLNGSFGGYRLILDRLNHHHKSSLLEGKDLC
ncbi:hypothetical protein K9M41_04700 [Candidatus Gracilibacteria bacterium]|nr:hypothetical protein [Candidatus Gracilibacteria bacterium]